MLSWLFKALPTDPRFLDAAGSYRDQVNACLTETSLSQISSSFSRDSILLSVLMAAFSWEYSASFLNNWSLMAYNTPIVSCPAWHQGGTTILPPLSCPYIFSQIAVSILTADGKISGFTFKCHWQLFLPSLCLFMLHIELGFVFILIHYSFIQIA